MDTTIANNSFHSSRPRFTSFRTSIPFGGNPWPTRSTSPYSRSTSHDTVCRLAASVEVLVQLIAEQLHFSKSTQWTCQRLNYKYHQPATRSWNYRNQRRWWKNHTTKDPAQFTILKENFNKDQSTPLQTTHDDNTVEESQILTHDDSSNLDNKTHRPEDSKPVKLQSTLSSNLRPPLANEDAPEEQDSLHRLIDDDNMLEKIQISPHVHCQPPHEHSPELPHRDHLQHGATGNIPAQCSKWMQTRGPGPWSDAYIPFTSHCSAHHRSNCAPTTVNFEDLFAAALKQELQPS